MENKSKRPLWAPWRLKYVKNIKSKKCFLCDRKDNFSEDDESNILFRGKYSFAIMNSYPYNPGHVLISPYRHTGDIADLSKDELYEMMDICVMLKNAIQDVMNPSGHNVGFNLGKAAGAGLAEHIHMHIVPRWDGDTNFMPVIGDIKVMPQVLSDTAKLLKDKISQMNNE